MFEPKANASEGLPSEINQGKEMMTWTIFPHFLLSFPCDDTKRTARDFLECEETQENDRYLWGGVGRLSRETLGPFSSVKVPNICLLPLPKFLFPLAPAISLHDKPYFPYIINPTFLTYTINPNFFTQ